MPFGRIESWIHEAVALFSADASIKKSLCKLGVELAETHTLEEALLLRPQFAAAMKSAGASDEQFRKDWARVLYKYAYPGANSCDGDYWMRAPDGVSVIRDKSRSSEIKGRRRSTQILPAPIHEEPADVAPIHEGLDVATLAKHAAVAIDKGQHVRVLVCGPSGCGKTSLTVDLVQMLMDDDETLLVKIVSGSDNAADFSVLTQAGADFADWNDGTALREIVEAQQASPKSNLIVIIDDVAIVAAGGKVLNEIFVNGRHFKCSVILLSQQANNLASPIVRGNLNFFIFGGLNGDQIQHVYKAIGLPVEVISKKTFTTWAYNSTGAPDHGFGVHIVTLKKETPIFLLKLDKHAEIDVGPAGAGGRNPAAKLAAVTEASNSQEMSQLEEPLFTIEGLLAEKEALMAENLDLQIEKSKMQTEMATYKSAIAAKGEIGTLQLEIAKLKSLIKAVFKNNGADVLLKMADQPANVKPVLDELRAIARE